MSLTSEQPLKPQHKHTTMWLQDNIQQLYKESNHDMKNVPTTFTPEFCFNTTITFMSAEQDPLLSVAEKSMKSLSTVSTTTQHGLPLLDAHEVQVPLLHLEKSLKTLTD